MPPAAAPQALLSRKPSWHVTSTWRHWCTPTLLAFAVTAVSGCGTTLVARKNTLGVLAGGAGESVTTGERVGPFGPPETIEGPDSGAGELLYRRQLRQLPPGERCCADLYLDVPVIFAPNMRPVPVTTSRPVLRGRLPMVTSVAIVSPSESACLLARE